MISTGADVNQSNGIKTPLVVACERGYITVVKQLIKAGVNINQSVGNKTLLIVAFEKKHWIVVKELNKVIADANESKKSKRKQKTPPTVDKKLGINRCSIF